MEDVEAEPELEVAATLARLRAAHLSLTEQTQMTQAFLDATYNAISDSWRLLEKVRGETADARPAFRALDGLED